MARWDCNWQGATQGRSWLRLQRDPRRGGPIQGGLSGGKSAPLNRTVGRDPLTSPPDVGAGSLKTRGRGAKTGRLVNAPSDDGASNATAIPNGRVGFYPFLPDPPLGETIEHAATVRTGVQQTLHAQIVREWAATLTGPFDWGDWPLAHYVFGEAFHMPLEHQWDLDNAAWVCAMVACGLVHEFPELDVQPSSAGSGGHQLAREDGGRGYRCTIVSGRGAGSRLEYWRLPSGVIEFMTFTAIRLVRSPDNTESA